ncbi:MAG: amidohydrolase family protein [Acidobacteria bacterium]|nr:amidohydrolase family protein [Acidobacteriota bacterium]
MKRVKKHLISACAASVFFLGFSHRVSAYQLAADLVIYNARILTADSPDPDGFRMAQAAAVYDGKFVAVGNNDEVLRYAGPETRRLDLGGRTVIPGLIETHDHIYGYSAHFFPEGTTRVGSTDPPIAFTGKADFLAQIRTMALRKKPGEWVITSPRGPMGFVLELQEGGITRFDLDQAAPNNPVSLHWFVDQEGLVNTKALELLLARHPNIPGVHRDTQGTPTGRISGIAKNTLEYEFWPQIPPEKLAPYYKMEMEEMAAQGLTTIATRLYPNHLAAYGWLYARNELPTRLAYTSEAVARNPQVDAIFSRLVGMQGGSGEHMWGLGDDRLWLIGMAASYNIDGTPGTASSCIEKTYPREHPDFPLWLHQFYGPHGLCTLADPDYQDGKGFRAAAKYGFRTSAMHSGGDRGITQFLDLVSELSQEYPDIKERRWVIDHCRFLTEEHARRAEEFNIIFSCGPKYVHAGERGDIGAYSVIYGEEVAADVVVPLRRLVEHGLRVTLQLDEHAFHPFLALEVAVNRKDENGKVWGPQQRVSRREALYMYTRWSSEYVLRERKLGSIEPKKYADFVVLNRDYLTVPEDEIGLLDPVLTVMDGEITYSDHEFAAGHGLPQVGYRGDRSHWKRGTPEESR